MKHPGYRQNVYYYMYNTKLSSILFIEIYDSNGVIFHLNSAIYKNSVWFTPIDFFKKAKNCLTRSVCCALFYSEIGDLLCHGDHTGAITHSWIGGDGMNRNAMSPVNWI